MTQKLLTILAALLFFSMHANDVDDIDDFSHSELIDKDLDFHLSSMDITGTNANSLTDLESEPTSTINHVVSVISGDYTESFTDYVVAGPDPLPIQRVYSSGERMSGSLCKGWHLGKYGVLNRWKCDDKVDGKGYRATIIGGGGARMTYYELEDRQYKLHNKCSAKGMTNTATGMLSGRTNPLNDRLESDRTKSMFTLRTGAGVVSKFDRCKHSPCFFLQSERKLSGLQTLYDYDSRNRITSISSLNRNGDHLTSILYGVPDKKLVTVKANGIEKVKYALDKIKDCYLITKACGPGGAEERYEYTSYSSKILPLLTKKVLPEGRSLEIEYFQKGDNEVPFGVAKLFERNEPRLYRVKALKAPVGHDATPHYIYKFVYNIGTKWVNVGKDDERLEVLNGDTCVYNVYNNLTRYFYNEDQRLYSVEKFKGTGPNFSLYTIERLFWNGPFLTNRIFHTKEGWAQFARQYDYDRFGNVARETLWGNLSGCNNKAIAYPLNGYPEYNGCEFEFKLFTYTDDGQNLMTSMQEGWTAKTRYTYVPGTDLLAKKLTGPLDGVKLRDFYDYDANGTVVTHIQDDGFADDRDNLQGVTERRIKLVTPTVSDPIGYPAIEEFHCLDLVSGNIILQKKLVHAYTPEGWPTKTDVYDSNGVLAFSERWEYDGKGNVIRHEDPMGRVTIKRYDANSNMVYEQGPRTDFHKEYAYDYSNRLIKTEAVCDNGLRLAERFHYDMCSNRVATDDYYGNRTTFSYDEFGRVTKTTFPLVLDGEGAPIQPTVETVFSELSFPNITTDPRGFTTVKHFTIKGAPYVVNYPDGSVESFVYNVDGTIQKQTHKNGSYTVNEYDYQKRPTKSETYSQAGQLIDGTYNEYSGYRLLKETTLGGITTDYTYDYAGHLVETRQGDARTTYAYDSLGRQTAVRTYFGPGGDDYVVKVQPLDALDRSVEEREEDSLGKVLKRTQYEYDAAGNIVKTINYTESARSITTAAYDPFGQQIEAVDAEGHLTRTEYSYDYVNDEGQRVPCHQTTDPLGNKTTTKKDALGRVVSVLKTNVMATALQSAIIYYDANGNKVRQVDGVFGFPDPTRFITTVWNYDACNRLISTIEAVGTPEQKQTHSVYNLFGQQERVVKPDGIQLINTYDQLGRLHTMRSSDNTLSLQYTYDIHGNAVRVDDLVNSTASLRSYDGNNRLVEETLGNGLVVGYSYDAMGRPLTTILPDASGVEYAYRASRLNLVRRLDRSGQATYTHAYQDYDFGGLLVKESYAGAVGEASYTYDAMGRLLSYEGPHVKETIEAYDKLGNLTSRTMDDPVEATACRYKYDNLSQLTEETGMAENRYRSDSLNNRRTKNMTRQVLNDLNQLLSDGYHAYTYDLNGNIIKKSSADGETVLIYDPLDRLVKVRKGSELFCYTYDELNRRLSKTVFSWSDQRQLWVELSHMRFLYHAQNEVGVVDADGVLVQYRMLGTGKGAEIGATVLIEAEGAAFVPLHDHIGNIVCLVEAASGLVRETYRYSAFGEEQLFDAAGEPLALSVNPWRFSSKRVDEETGFIYFGRRYYEPSAGRWMTADPMGFEAGPNLYAYVLNNPLTHYDLYGLFGVGGSVSSTFEGAVTTLFNQGREFIKTGLQLPGAAVEYLALQCIPIPGVQDAVRAVGTLLQGKCLCGFQTWHDMRSRSGEFGGTELDESNITMLVNGMNTSWDDFMNNVHEASTEIGGHKIHYCYNGSHGFFADLIECGMQKLNVPTHSVEVMTKKCRELSNRMGNEGTINIYAHSQAGLIVSNLTGTLSSSIRQQMNVNTFGSATQISNDDFGGARNYVSSRDPVPWVDLRGMFRAHFTSDSNTTILKSNYLGFDHGWGNDTYKGAMKRNLKAQYEQS